MSGKNGDWRLCIAGCVLHDYTDKEKQLLVWLGIIQDVKVLEHAQAEPHYVCRVFCHRHKGGGCITIKSKTESNIAQHLFKKTKIKPFIQLLLYVTFHCI